MTKKVFQSHSYSFKGRLCTTLFLTLLLGLVLPLQAARVDTLLITSASMRKAVEVIVVVPDLLPGDGRVNCPTIYLLHGYGGDARTWLGIKPDLPQIADEKGVLFVCPDGKNSWYWDSPLQPAYRYETFISNELIAAIDGRYATIRDRRARAITGLSMGGHGALWNALRHKEQFGAAGSTSGGVDICPFPQNWEMSKQLGTYAANKERWKAHAVINQLGRIENGDLALIIDCGEADFFLEVNRNLHYRLLARGIDHDYITRPGGHNSVYWNNAIDYQILFFDKFFKKR